MALLHAPALQTARLIAFDPLVDQADANVAADPVAGVPPAADQDQDVTVPFTVGVQLKDSPQFANCTPSRPDVAAPAHPRETIVGAVGGGGVVVVGTAVVGTAVVGTAVVGTAVVGTAVVGTAVVGTAVVGTAVVVAGVGVGVGLGVGVGGDATLIEAVADEHATPLHAFREIVLLPTLL